METTLGFRAYIGLQRCPEIWGPQKAYSVLGSSHFEVEGNALSVLTTRLVPLSIDRSVRNSHLARSDALYPQISATSRMSTTRESLIAVAILRGSHPHSLVA